MSTVSNDVVVPNNNIAIFVPEHIGVEQASSFIVPLPSERSWMDDGARKYTPLTSINGRGFGVTLPFDLVVNWDGTEDPSGVTIDSDIDQEDVIFVGSIFPSGILSIGFPFILRTPEGVNLDITPTTNYFFPNISAMSLSIEADKESYPFVVNLKILIPDYEVFIPAGTPIAAVVPTVRNTFENINIVDANNLFDDKTINDQLKEYSNQIEELRDI